MWLIERDYIYGPEEGEKLIGTKLGCYRSNIVGHRYNAYIIRVKGEMGSFLRTKRAQHTSPHPNPNPRAIPMPASSSIFWRLFFDRFS
jgi:hypothetical protein